MALGLGSVVGLGLESVVFMLLREGWRWTASGKKIGLSGRAGEQTSKERRAG
jgi:hypothetical protein